MSRPIQIFVAPGDEDSPLLNEASPWVVNRWVSIPAEQWSVLLEAAKQKTHG